MDRVSAYRPASQDESSTTLRLVDGGILLCGLLALDPQSLWAVPAALLAARLGAVVGALVAEWSHLVAGDGLVARHALWNGSNLLGHAPLRAHLLALVPFAPDYRGELYVEVRADNPSVLGRMRTAGFWLAALYAGVGTLWMLRQTFGSGWWWPTLAWSIGVGISVMGGYLTDLSPRLPRDFRAA